MFDRLLLIGILAATATTALADEDAGRIHEIRLMHNSDGSEPIVTVRLSDDNDKADCAENTSKLIELDTEIGRYWYRALSLAWANDLPVWIRGTKICKSKAGYVAEFETVDQIVLLSKDHGYLD